RPNATVRRWRRVDTLGDASSRNDSVAHALEAIGDRWSMHIVHEAMRGTLRFAELQGVLGIATNTLTQRLRSLCREGVLVRGPGEGRGSTGYALTDAGRGLLPVLLSIRAWGAQWRGVGESWRIVHRDCGGAFEVECRCDACEELIDPRQVRVEAPQD
ncbi:MAG: helix-turn-helix domain-containing protein, partial [Polyangiales bacterium]